MRRVLILLFNAILRTGRIPKGWMRLYLIPLLKPGKAPSRCDSRRPIH